MASDTLTIPSHPHHSFNAGKSKGDAISTNSSEDELLKFFLHGSYDVQRGETHTTRLGEDNENNDKTVCSKDEKLTVVSTDDSKKTKSRCMFEETYMINISVKQPVTMTSSKQIDVHIEKTPPHTDIGDENGDDDEISSIYGEEDDEDDVDSVILKELNSSPPVDSSESTPTTTKLTLADMISKTLTTIPAPLSDNVDGQNINWYIDERGEIKRMAKDNGPSPHSTSVSAEKVIKSPAKSPLPPPPTVQQKSLSSNICDDEKLIRYLDYLDTKEEPRIQKENVTPITSLSNNPKMSKSQPQQQQQKQQEQRIPISAKNNRPFTNTQVTPKQNQQQQQQQQQLPVIDLEQLCRSLTVTDLKDELIRKKIHELSILLEERHKQQRVTTSKSQIPVAKTRKDDQDLPILIAMPPVRNAYIEQRRRHNEPCTLLQSKTVDFRIPPYQYPPPTMSAPYNCTYQDIIFNNNQALKINPQYARRMVAPTSHKSHY